MYWMEFLMTLTQGHGCDIDKQKFACLQDKVRTTQPITTKLSGYIPLVMFITWLDSVGNSFFFAKISLKGGGVIDMERKGCELIIHDHDRDPGGGWMYRIGDCGDVGVPSTYLVFRGHPSNF